MEGEDPGVPCHGVFETALEGGRDWSNPYFDVEFKATFTHTQSGRAYAIEGFWDGGNVFRLRLAPTVVGAWTYTTVSNNPALNGVSGAFQCVPSAGHGFIRVDTQQPHHFCYSDGTPFYWAAATLTPFGRDHSDDEDTGMGFARYQAVVDARAEQGFTVLYSMGDLFEKPGFNERTQRNEGGAPFVGYGSARLNPAFFRGVDRRIEHVMSRGLVQCIGLGWPDQGIWERIGRDHLRRAWRYLIARYGAYHVSWVIFGEYDEFGPEAEAIADEFGRLTRACDPYGHPLTTHSTRTSGRLAGHDWFDYTIQQSLDWRLIAEDRARDKPVVNAEYYYENRTGERFPQWGHIVTNPHLIRTGAWEIASRGGYFVYEIWGATENWPDHLRTEATTYVKHLHGLMRHLPFRRLAPADGLADSGTCLSDRRRHLLCYLPCGGRVNVDLRDFDPPLRARWYDPRTGAYCRAGAVTGEHVGAAAPDVRDWVLPVDPMPAGWGDGSLPLPPAYEAPSLAVLRQGAALVDYDFGVSEGVVANHGALGTALDLTADEPGRLRPLEGGGLEIVQGVTLKTRGPARALTAHLMQANRFLIEVDLEAANAAQEGPARIVSLSANPSLRDLTLGQAGACASLRMRTSVSNANGLPEWTPAVRVFDGGRVRLAVLFDGVDCYLFKDDELVAVQQGEPRDLADWEMYPLCVANEADGSRPWLGKLWHLRIWASP